MLTGLAALETTDWSRLLHAYGRATDVPEHLNRLLEENSAHRKETLSYLWSAILHQGTPWTATAPVALVIVGLLSDERLDRGEPIRADLLSFLVSVVKAPEELGLHVEELERLSSFDIEPYLDSDDYGALYENEDASNSLFARSVLGCINVAPEVMTVMLEELEHNDSRVRACAGMGAAYLTQKVALKSHYANVQSKLLELANSAANSDERSAHVLSIGQMGGCPKTYLEDPSQAVRMCAALAPGLATDQKALSELVQALKSADSIDDWFIDYPPHFDMSPRFAVVARLVDKIKDFELLALGAEAVALVASKYSVDFDWGPLLAAAFPEGNGVVNTEAQRKYLRTLTSKTELWDPRFVNARNWFERAGLPYDRQACLELVQAKL